MGFEVLNDEHYDRCLERTAATQFNRYVRAFRKNSLSPICKRMKTHLSTLRKEAATLCEMSVPIYQVHTDTPLDV
jgi:hypothetical protein